MSWPSFPASAGPDAASPAPATAWGLLRRGVWRQRRTAVPGLVLTCLWQLGETLVPIVIGVVIDRGVAARDLSGLLWSLALLAALFLAFSISYRFGGRLNLRAMLQEEHDLRHEVVAAALSPTGRRADEGPGELLSLATADASLVSMVFRQLAFAVAAAFALVVVAVYLFSVDVLVALLVLLGVPTVVALTQVLTPLVARTTAEQQDAIARATGLATDLVVGLRPLKGVQAEDTAALRYREASQTASRATIRTARSWGALAGATSGLSGVLLSIIAVVTGWRAVEGDVSLGQLVAIVGLAQFLAEPITGLGELSAQAAQSHAAGRRLLAYLRRPALVADGDGTVRAGSQLQLHDVVGGTVDGLSLQTSPGRLLAVVADDPATSIDLMRLLDRTLVPAAGRVTLGDDDLASLAIASRIAHLLAAPHDTSMTESTLRATIDPDAVLDDASLAAVLTASGADQLAEEHPDGLDRPVSAEGASLSGGQRQRLALARVLAADAPVLVLHDPTTAVDSVTERLVAEQLRDLRRTHDAATLVLTASPAFLAVADEVVLVVDGREAARGTHRELLERSDYRALVLR